MGIHQMLAAVTKVPELALEKAEASALAGSAAEVAKYYPAALMSPKSMAWTGLASTVAMVYLPRLAIIRMRVAEARGGKVVPIEPADLPGAPLSGAFGAALGDLAQAA